MRLVVFETCGAFAIGAMFLLAACGEASASHASADGSVDDADGGVTGKHYIGGVSFEVSSGVYTIRSQFFDWPTATSTSAPSAGTSCMGTQIGDCCYTPPVKVPANAANASPASVTFGDAGPIVVHDGARKLGTLTFSADVPDASTSMGAFTTSADYTQLSSAYVPELKWNGGDTLDVAASGGATIGAFIGSVVAPSPLTAVTPKLDYLATQKTPLEIPLAKAFVVSWNPDTKTSGTTQLHVTAAGDTTSRGDIICTVKDSTGMATVPAALVAKYNSGDQGAVFLIRQVAASPLHIGGADVTISAAAAEEGFVTFK